MGKYSNQKPFTRIGWNQLFASQCPLLSFQDRLVQTGFCAYFFLLFLFYAIIISIRYYNNWCLSVAHIPPTHCKFNFIGECAFNQLNTFV